MEKHPISSRDAFDFKNFVPYQMVADYFNAITSDSKVYLCIVQNEDQVSAIYLERPEESNPNIDGIVRMFFNLEDLKKYGKSVSNTEEISYDLVRRWEMSFTSLIDHLLKLDAKHKSMGKKGIRVVASAVYADKFLDVDTVWTTESDIMV
jgi:hypothetical protein